MKWMIVIALTCVSHAQTLPEAPKPHINKVEFTMIGVQVAARVTDYLSTEKGLKVFHGHINDILPKPLIVNKPVFAAYELGCVAADYYSYRFALHHHVPRGLMLVGQVLFDGYMAHAVTNNYKVIGAR